MVVGEPEAEEDDARAAAMGGEQKKLPDGDLAQPMLKPLVPAGGSLWRGNNNGSWNSHFPPYPRFSASVHLYGHRESAVMCLRSLWEHYLHEHLLELADCPIEGLFLADGIAAIAAA